MKTKNQQCNLYLLVETVVMLDKLASATGKPRSTLVNEILVEHLRNELVKMFIRQPQPEPAVTE